MAAKSGRETTFWEKLPVNSADTLWVKHFVKIAVAHSCSQINMFLHFTQKFKMVAKSGGENHFRENLPVDSTDTLHGQKFRQNSSSLFRFQDKHVFVFYAEIQDGSQKRR